MRQPFNRSRYRRCRRPAAAALVKIDDDDDGPPISDGNYGVLPADVLYDILLRLPANHLCRLRLVCRSWRSLTSDPFFAKDHSRRRPHVIALRQQRQDELHVIDLRDRIIVKTIQIAQPGARLLAELDLVCVEYPHFLAWGGACVLNLQQGTGSAAIADITADHQVLRCSSSLMAPSYILGHVPSTGEYKMFCLYDVLAGYQAPNSKEQICHVMTLGSSTGRRWREAQDAPVLLAKSMAVVSGVVYFLVDHYQYCSDSVASFDLATEEWRSTILQGPVQPSTKDGMFRLVELADCLVMVHCNIKDSIMDLWYIEDTSKSLWTKRFSIQWTTIADFQSIGHVAPLMVSDGGRIVFWVPERGIIGAYDPKTSSWINLVRMGDHFAVAMHQGSLLCSGLKVY
ncbi:unnamed protein product [Urochloa decumbens]|uniref:F-box domain-containing protein n=1 Tax=Urochloa decumbens TaxID=240449 RepID=A0ABC8WCM2_9POAL